MSTLLTQTACLVLAGAGTLVNVSVFLYAYFVYAQDVGGLIVRTHAFLDSADLALAQVQNLTGHMMGLRDTVYKGLHEPAPGIPNLGGY